LKDPDVDGRIILKWIFERLNGGPRTESIWLRIWTGSSESRDEPSNSIKCGEFLE
jgi:hypothetical protein